MPRRAKKDYQDFPVILKGVKQIAEFLGCSPQTVSLFVQQNAPIRRVGKVYYADKAALRQWLGGIHAKGENDA